MDKKICSICKEEKELSEFYSKKRSSKTKGEYIYYPPYCKKCTSEKAYQWGLENKERKNKSTQKFFRTPKGIETSKRRREKYVKSGKRQEWINNNKDKLKEYAKNHRKHSITEKEWIKCKEYFNNECAYCGISQEEHKEIHHQDLHKEHVFQSGTNDLSNCIPACKNCNSQKSNFEFENWFNEENVNFTYERLNKIIKWTEEDYKN